MNREFSLEDQLDPSQLESLLSRRIRFMLVGKTGMGKSSTINSLLGYKIALVGDHEATTFEVAHYPVEINGISFDIYDTPGLCDELPEAGNDAEYLERMRSVTEVDCICYVARLDGTRLGADEQRAIQLISNGFGDNVWQHSVIIFTFSNSVPLDRFKESLEKRSQLFRKEISKYVAPSIADNIPAVPIDNTSARLNDGTVWLPELFTVTVERISGNGLDPFLFANVNRMGEKSAQDDNAFTLNSEQKERINERVEKQENSYFSKLLQLWRVHGEKVCDAIENLGEIIPLPKVKLASKLAAKVLRFFVSSNP